MSGRRRTSTPAGAPLRPDRGTRAIAFGEVVFDRLPDGRRILGGAPFNVAWHLCGFGGDPLLLSAVGDDDDGREVLDQMDAWGLSTGGVWVDPDHTTGEAVATQREGREGEARFTVPPDQPWEHLRPDRLPDGLSTQGAGLVYFGTLPLRSEASWESLRYAVEALDAPCFVDLNLSGEHTSEQVDWCIGQATWLKCSARELTELTGVDCSTPDDCVKAAVQLRREYDVPTLVVTRATDGSFLVTHDDEVLHAEAPPVEDLVDTVGAGDAFSAVLCHGILQGWQPHESLRRASGFAAEACRFEGAVATDLSVYESHLRRWADSSRRPGTPDDRGLYILSLTVHGLVRGEDIELGRDSDTGGQVSYVIDQARALAGHPAVERVDVVTRQVEDRKVDDTYAEPTEDLGDGARIVRLPFGPRRYLRKESLWPYLDSLLDQLIRHVRAEGRIPDVVHSHYADAGYVGAQLSKLLGVPFVFTGHSLGRVKRQRLLADGGDEEQLEERYHLTRRIEAEEQALETASLVITSTRQEVSEQYEGYDHYAPGRMEIIPPGVDLERFSPPSRFWTEPDIAADIRRFLEDPDKPMILAIARADDRKNFQGLVRAYAQTPGLRDVANLVVVAGNRDDIREMDSSARRVLTEILMLVDKYDLYGSVAYPKHHGTDDVPDLYRMAAHTRGVFVNPALTEPFGLTLIEAAASGLPVVATNDGGPRDILEECGNGLLADPLDTAALGNAILEALTDRRRWALWAKSGVARVHERFSWKSHARRYVDNMERLLMGQPHLPTAQGSLASRLPRMDRILVTDVDDTLTGDDEALAALTTRLGDAGGRVGFGLATGRPLDRAVELVEKLDGPEPDVYITASGTELHYGPRRVRDRSWERRIRYRWRPEAVERALEGFPGIRPRDDWTRTEYRLRYEVDPDSGVTLADVRSRLRQMGVQATPILDHGRFLDIIPIRASLGMAIRFFCFKWNLAPECLLVAGDSGNDADMLSGDTLGVVVGNHTEELESLHGRPRIFFAEGRHAWGVLQGVEHYHFFDEITVPEEEGIETG